MSNSSQVIKRPIITEKGTVLREVNSQYVFEVALKSNKNQIKEALKRLFDVDATEVRTSVVRGKYVRVGRSRGKKSNWKKAIVTLKEGQSIELFDGV